MQSYSLKHLKDQPLLDGLDDSFVRCYANAAMRLAHVAEVDARQLYRQSGYPSMTAYCMNSARRSCCCLRTDIRGLTSLRRSGWSGRKRRHRQWT